MSVIMTPVKSSNIKAIGYDVEKLILNVEFKNGKTFGYKYISSPEYEALVNAESVGKHFNQFVKGDKVAFEILDAKEECPNKDEIIAELTLKLSSVKEKLLLIEKVALTSPVERLILSVTQEATSILEKNENV